MQWQLIAGKHTSMGCNLCMTTCHPVREDWSDSNIIGMSCTLPSISETGICIHKAVMGHVFHCFSISQSFISISAAIYWKIYRKPEKYVILSTLKIPIGDRIGKSTAATSKVNSSTWPKVKTTNKNFIQIKPYLKSLNLQKTKAPNLTHWDRTYCVCRHLWLDFDRLPTHVNVMSLNLHVFLSDDAASGEDFDNLCHHAGLFGVNRSSQQRQTPLISQDPLQSILRAQKKTGEDIEKSPLGIN